MSDPSPNERLLSALRDDDVRAIASLIRDQSTPSLTQVLEMGRALAAACGVGRTASLLAAELGGYDGRDEQDLPEVRRVVAYASPFPVRALDLGLLDPEEIFLVNREKFSQVTLTIGQPIEELESALRELGEGGVLSLRLPAAEINGRSADTDDDDYVYVYVLPREIRKILDFARQSALEALLDRLVEAAGEHA